MTIISSDIVTRAVTDQQILKAKEIRKERDQRYGNIYSEKMTDLRWVGDLGEIIINELFSMCNKEKTEWHLDEVTNRPDFTFCNETLDVKTVKRKVPIKLSYTAQITAKHANTPMNYIVFTCYEYPKKKLHILGVIKKSEFLEKANYYKEGDQVHGNYIIRKGHEIYNIKIENLYPFRDFIRKKMKDLIKAA